MLPSEKRREPFQNLILNALPREEYARLRPSLEAVQLKQGKLLYGVGGQIRHAYFLAGGMASLVAVTESGASVEVGMIGNEGMVGLPSVLGINFSVYGVVMQLPGNALRIKADALRAEFNRGGMLQSMLLQYIHTLLTQLSQSAACNRFHTAEERLGRWLLVSRDRVQTDTLNFTQEFLSQMIGAPRTSVTAVAGNLQKSGLILYRRGKVRILDREGLASASCECYRVVRDEMSQFLAA